MKKIIFSLFISLLAFQVNAASLGNIGTLSAPGDFLSTGAESSASGVAFDDNWDVTVAGAAVGRAITFTFNTSDTPGLVGSGIFDTDVDVENGTLFADTILATAGFTQFTAILGAGTFNFSMASLAGGLSPFPGAYSVALTVSDVPVPAAVWLFGSALMGLVGVSRRKSA